MLYLDFDNEKYYASLKDLYFSSALLSPMMKKYVISCYLDDISSNHGYSDYDCDRVILSLICTLPEEMQLSAYRMIRNNEIKLANNYFRNIDKSVSDKITMLQRNLTPKEILEGIEMGEDSKEQLTFASEWVSKILISDENEDVIELICKKYRDVSFLEKVFKDIDDVLSCKVNLYYAINLFARDNSIDENWKKEFKYIEDIIYKLPEEDRKDIEYLLEPLYEKLNSIKGRK